jgi:hypothetical protein
MKNQEDLVEVVAEIKQVVCVKGWNPQVLTPHSHPSNTETKKKEVIPNF